MGIAKMYYMINRLKYLYIMLLMLTKKHAQNHDTSICAKKSQQIFAVSLKTFQLVGI